MPNEFVPTDYLGGSFEFDTELVQKEGKWTASALGFSATHDDASQAVNDLNAFLNDKMERGELIPNQG